MTRASDSAVPRASPNGGRLRAASASARGGSTRPTRLGVGCALAGLLTLLSALSTGNNLLYVLYSQILALFVVSWGVGRRNVRGLSLGARDAPGATRGKAAPYLLRLLNESSVPRYALRLQDSRAGVEALAPGEAAERSVRLALPHRGLNRLEGLRVESLFPFALWRHREPVGGPVLLAVPQPPATDPGAESEASGLREGSAYTPGGPGDEFFGARPYDASDGPRRVNWKLTARTGSLFVNEYRAPGGGRRTVRLAQAADLERAILEAAAACRAAITAGAEVRLITPEREVPYGRGTGHLQRMLEALALVGEGAKPRPAAPPPGGWDGPGLDEPAIEWVTRLGGAWVYASLFLIEEIDPLVLGVFAPLLGLGAWLRWRGGPWLPKRAADFLSLAVLLYGVLFDWKISGITVATTHLVGYVLLNRALTAPDGRYGLAFLSQFLAFFLVSGQTINLRYFVFFIGYAAYAAAWLALAHGAQWRERARWRRSAALTAGTALTVGVAIFLVTPRIEPRGQLNPAAAIGLDRLKSEGPSVVGFTENVSLGFFGTLKRSTTKALRVAPLPPPASAPGHVLIRGNAYESFDGHRWTRASARFEFDFGKRRLRAGDGRAWSSPASGVLRFVPPSAQERVYDITVFPMHTSVIFSVGPLRAVRADPRLRAYMDHLDSGYFSIPYSEGVRYHAYADPQSASLWPAIADSGRLHRRLLHVAPGMDPRIAALALRIGGRKVTEAEKVWAVEEHLKSQYSYSLFGGDGKANLEDFLFKTKRGNCEYFATAAAILLRHLGIPTRLVTGFSAWDWNEYGKFYDVRQSQAHAWVEALVNGRWMTVDATPPDAGFMRTFGDQFTKYLDALEARWYTHVIGYDRFAQRNTFLRAGRNLAQLPDLDWRPLRPYAAGLALLAALAFAARRWRRRALKGLFGRAEAIVAPAGFARSRHETPLEFARLVTAKRPALAPLETVARLHYRERFGPGLTPGERADAEALIESLRALVK